MLKLCQRVQSNFRSSGKQRGKNMSSSNNQTKTAQIVGSGADKKIVLGFKPRYVKVLNVTDLKTLEKSDSMADGQALQRVTAGTLSEVDHLDLASDGFTLKAAAHSADDEIHYWAYEGKNE